MRLYGVYWYRDKQGETQGGVESVEGNSDQLSEIISKKFEGQDEVLLFGINLIFTKEEMENFIINLESQLIGLVEYWKQSTQKIERDISMKTDLIQKIKERIRDF